jgi:hypothetical protein
MECACYFLLEGMARGICLLLLEVYACLSCLILTQTSEFIAEAVFLIGINPACPTS